MQNDPRYYGGQGSHYGGYDAGASNYYDQASYYPSYNPPSYYGGGGAGGSGGGAGAGAGGFFDYDYSSAAPAVAPSFGANGVELQASDNCPNNYLIFDHTDNRSRIMYNPAFGNGGGFGGYQYYPTSFQAPPEPAAAAAAAVPAVAPPLPVQHAEDDYRTAWRDDTRGKSSLWEDDTEDIDALLSLEDEEEDEDDVVSTGRTPSSKYRCTNSPDSTCSTGGSKSVSQRDYAGSSAGSSPVGEAGGCAGGKKKKKTKDRMKKMVKVLRGIVPGGQQMDTPAVLDEAVKYLKSLKVEARKLGIRS